MIKKQWVTTDGTIFRDEFTALAYEKVWKTSQHLAYEVGPDCWRLIRGKADFLELSQEQDMYDFALGQLHSRTNGIPFPYILYIDKRNLYYHYDVYPCPAAELKNYADQLLDMANGLEDKHQAEIKPIHFHGKTNDVHWHPIRNEEDRQAMLRFLDGDKRKTANTVTRTAAFPFVFFSGNYNRGLHWEWQLISAPADEAKELATALLGMIAEMGKYTNN